jgi:hypothetical protein
MGVLVAVMVATTAATRTSIPLADPVVHPFDEHLVVTELRRMPRMQTSP